MIHDRRALLSLLLADLFVMAGAVFVLADRYQLMKGRAAGVTPPVSAEAPADAPAEPQAPAAPARAASAAAKGVRHILFSYRNSKPARVEVVGSFNGWEPLALKKGKNHTWTVSVPLEPGDHTYNYLVDGKAIRDPNNPRTAPEGRSLLTVKPLD